MTTATPPRTSTQRLPNSATVASTSLSTPLDISVVDLATHASLLIVFAMIFVLAWIPDTWVYVTIIVLCLVPIALSTNRARANPLTPFSKLGFLEVSFILAFASLLLTQLSLHRVTDKAPYFIFAVIVTVCIGSARIVNGESVARSMHVAALAATLGIWLLWLTSGHITDMYQGPYENPNTLGSAVFGILLVLLVTGRQSRISMLLDFAITVPMIYLTGSRSALLAALALLIALAVFFLHRKTGPSLLLSVSMILAALLVVMLIVYIYPTLSGTELGTRLDALSVEYFHKSLFTGRQLVWESAYSSIQAHPWLGGGDEASLQVYGITVSAHNLFLSCLLRSGIVGLATTLLLILAIYTLFFRLPWPYGPLGQAMIIAVLIHESFEVTLTQINVDVGVLVWLAWGLLAARALQQTPQTSNTQPVLNHSRA